MTYIRKPGNLHYITTLILYHFTNGSFNITNYGSPSTAVGSGEITTNKNILQHVKMVDAETDKIEAYCRPGLASAWLYPFGDRVSLHEKNRSFMPSK